MARFLLLCLILADACVSLTMASAPSPSPAPMIRKMGKHQNAPALSPSNEQSSREAQAVPETEDNVSILDQKFHLKHHHVDRSVAGGGVILGGLATTFLVAVFCYIRATARHKTEITGAQVSS